MSKRPWIKNGKPLLVNGVPIVCETCPCGSSEECEDKVSSTVQSLLGQIDPETQQAIWSMVGSYSSSFICAQWGENPETHEKILVSPSQGTLLMAVPHVASLGLEYSPVPFLSATVLYNVKYGFYRTIGCQCEPDISTYECSHKFAYYDNYDIAGLVPVYVPDDSSDSDSSPDWNTYTINDVCRFDKCSSLKTWLIALYRWYGGELHGQGFVDWWDGGHPEYDWNLIEWYRFSKFLMAWVYRGVDGYKHYVYIDCDCEGMSARTITETHMLHDFDGICDMDDDCTLQVMCHMRWYLDLEADVSDSGSESTFHPQWVEVGFWNGEYVCPEWEQIEGTWTMVKPPSGKLVVAYPYALPDTSYHSPMSSVDACGRKFVTAGVIRNTQTGEFKLFGCECYIYNMNCSPRYTMLDGYMVGGLLSPRQESGYSCDVDSCQATELYMSSLHAWHPETIIRGEGFIEYINPSNKQYSYTKYKKALQWGADASDSDSDSGNDGYILYKPCGNDCYCWLTWTALGDGYTIRDANGICQQDCPDYFALRASANAHGWEWHDEGFVIHKCYKADESTYPYTYHIADWFDIDNAQYYMKGKACAMAGDIWYVLSCNCTSTQQAGYYIDEFDTTVIDRWGMGGGGEAPEGFYEWYEYENACTCIDLRELILDNPEKWGVTDISYGTHTKYHYTMQYQSFIDDTMVTEDRYDIMGYRYEIAHSGNVNMYLDYRTFCWIQKYLDSTFSTKYAVRSISPDGSPAKSYDKGAPQYDSGLYDTVEFAGHAIPFTRDNDLNWDWAGRHLEWSGGCMSWESCYYTEQEAWDYANGEPQHCNGACGLYAYDIPRFRERLSPPDHSEVLLNDSSVRYDSSSGMWCGRRKAYGIGRKVGNSGYIVYREQWMDTNKGIIVYGESNTYHDSLLVYGIQGSSGNPNWGNCYGHSGVPYEDTTYDAQIVDDDMHGCPDHDVDWMNDSDSEDSESV